MSETLFDIEKYLGSISAADPIRLSGIISTIIGLTIESTGPASSIGELCLVENQNSGCCVEAEVVGFKGNKVLLMPLGEIQGVAPGSTVTATGEPFSVAVGEELLGRILDGLGKPIDGKGKLQTKRRRSVYNSPPQPLSRRRITEPLGTGIRAIDALLTCGKGQRIGIFSGSGVGKSVLMGMIARNSVADVNVIALVGERGREVRDFIERDLGEEGLKKSVVVAATSDKPALVRLKGALVATTVAEYFRDQGMDVMLMMDSVTRIAVAQREVGLTIGEPPTTKGFTPSVFALLPRLLERAGTSEKGSITGLYTVLVEGDDVNEPISDAVRAILDGHIVLSRKLATLNHYPAIDILNSVSRVMIEVTTPEHQQAANKLKEVLATYQEAEDLINIGAYVQGSNPKIDYAIDNIDKINTFLKQDIDEKADFDQNSSELVELWRSPESENNNEKI